jgi:hypothetical protein
MKTNKKLIEVALPLAHRRHFQKFGLPDFREPFKVVGGLLVFVLEVPNGLV